MKRPGGFLDQLTRLDLVDSGGILMIYCSVIHKQLEYNAELIQISVAKVR